MITRTFQTFKYVVNQTVSVEQGWLYKMGSTPNYATPKIAYGNRDGLLREHEVPNGLRRAPSFLLKPL